MEKMAQINHNFTKFVQWVDKNIEDFFNFNFPTFISSR